MSTANNERASQSRIPALFFLCFTLSLIFIFSPEITEAQFSDLQNGTISRLEIDPQYPPPDTTFTVRFADYSGGGSPSGLQWYIDGELREEFSDKVIISLTAPALGTPMRIEGRAKTSSGTEKKLSAVTVPSTVDFIFEGDTTAPYFYKGRRVPVIGAEARVIAVPHIFNGRGERLSPNALTFRWSVGGAVVEEGRGKQSFAVTIPVFGDATVDLMVESSDSSVRYETYAEIPLSEPMLLFYPYNPLTGLSPNVIYNAMSTSESEVTIHAEPYFLARNVFADAQYGWTLNGSPVANTHRDPRTLSLRKVGTGGTSEVGFSIRNLKALSQYAQGLFVLEFK